MSEIKDTYQTIKKTSVGEFKDRGSKFIAYIIPCENEKDAKFEIDKLRKENPNACHVCFAWRFGNFESYLERFSDDGEPNNSAGKPIFGQIQAYEITNVLIAVVRYYGGTNLGVGGLIQAYKTAAKTAIDNGEIIEKLITIHLKIEYKFGQTGLVMNLLNRFDAKITDQNYSESKTITNFVIRKNDENKLKDEILENSHLGIKLMD